jgi:RsiW-degrading membrane proteinase PrsW (M82 family)
MSAMSMVVFARRWAWVAVFVGGTALYLVMLNTLVDSQDPNYVPSMVLLAGAVVPATFVALAATRPGGWRVGGTLLMAAAFIGGVIGIVTAARLGYDSLRQLAPAPMAAAALVEEAAKLIVPAAAVGLWRWRREPSDGLVIGMSIGMGFAALETMAHTFTTLLDAQGNIGAVEQLLFLRGLLSPAGNAAWTGLACVALWRVVADPRAAIIGRFAGTFVAVVALHALWDGLHSLLGYLVLSVISVAWLLWELYRTRPALAPAPQSQR